MRDYKINYNVGLPRFNQGRPYFNPLSSETLSFLRPFLRRLANTARPLAVSIRYRKPMRNFI